MPDVQHHLITIDLLPVPMCFHAYLMTTNHRKHIEGVVNKMMTIIEQEFGPGVPLVPIVLATHLTTAADDVRRELGKRNAEMAATMKAATDFHLSMWMQPSDDPWNDRLMALH